MDQLSKLDPAGGPLDFAMRRWQMSNRDLDDLLAFLKNLDVGE